jgi:hypothetical protein
MPVVPIDQQFDGGEKPVSTSTATSTSSRQRPGAISTSHELGAPAGE